MAPASKSRAAAAARKQGAADLAHVKVEHSSRREPDIDHILDAVRRSEELQRRPAAGGRAAKGPSGDSSTESTAPSECAPSAAHSACEEPQSDAGCSSSEQSPSCTTPLAPVCNSAVASEEAAVAHEAAEAIVEAAVVAECWAEATEKEVGELAEPLAADNAAAESEDEDDEEEGPAKRGRKRQRRRRRHGKRAAAEGELGAAGEVSLRPDGAATALPATLNRSVVTLSDLGLGDLTPAATAAPPTVMSPMSTIPVRSVACVTPMAWVAVEQHPQPWVQGPVVEVYSTMPMSPSRPRQGGVELFSTTPVNSGSKTQTTCTFMQMPPCSPTGSMQMAMPDAGVREPVQPPVPPAPPTTPAARAAQTWLLASGLEQMSGTDLEAHLKAVAPETYED